MSKHVETESIDRLFLELSQFTQATTAKELALNEELKRTTERLERIADAAKKVTTCMASQVPTYLEDLEKALEENA